MASVVEKYIASVIVQGDLTKFRMEPSIKPFLQFCDQNDQTSYAVFESYVQEFHALPSLELLSAELGVVGLKNPEAPPEFWSKRLESQHIRRALATVAQGIGEKLNQGDEEKLLADARKALQELDKSRSAMRVVDFRQGLDILQDKWGSKHSSLSLGWPTLDNMSGGARAGDLYSMVARPKLGKTYLLAYSALHVWATSRKPVLFVSNEMAPEMIVERLAALATSTPADLLKTNLWPSFGKGGFQGKQSQNKVKQAFIDKMHVIETDDVPIWIVDGNLSATVDDTVALADRLGAAICYADGAYLFQDQRERNMYARIALVCQDLKMKLASELKIPVFASWQFSREATKLKPGEQPGLEHIAHSDSIGQLSSVVMGMFQSESIETKKRREVSILAGRSGEVGRFETNWDFDKMDLSEFIETEQEFAPFEMA